MKLRALSGTKRLNSHVVPVENWQQRTFRFLSHILHNLFSLTTYETWFHLPAQQSKNLLELAMSFLICMINCEMGMFVSLSKRSNPYSLVNSQYGSSFAKDGAKRTLCISSKRVVHYLIQVQVSYQFGCLIIQKVLHFEPIMIHKWVLREKYSLMPKAEQIGCQRRPYLRVSSSKFHYL